MYNSTMNDENPKNLDECIAALTRSVPQDVAEKLKSGTITPVTLHHTLGRFMRNKWNLWGESELKQWFKGIGIWHPDDMSSIIMDSFVSSLRGEPIDLEKQVKFFQEYWEKMKVKEEPTSLQLQYVEGKWLPI